MPPTRPKHDPDSPVPETPPSAESDRDPKDALGDVLGQHLPAVHSYVLRRMGTLLRQKESASDIVQSVCREVLQDVEDVPHVVNSERELRHWLLVTAARKLVNRSRYNQADKRNPGQRILSLDHAADDGNLSLSPPDDDPHGPESRVEMHEEMGRLEHALQSLPEEYRQVFVWRHIQGVSRVDIAKKLDKTPNAVSKLLGRATARLARELREKDGSD